LGCRFLKTMAEPSEREALTRAKTLVSIPFYVVGYAAPDSSEPHGVAIAEPATERADTPTQRVETEPDFAISGSADPREATSFSGSVETPAQRTLPQPAAPAPSIAKPIGVAEKRSRRPSWIGGLSAVAVLFICGILVMFQLRQNPEVTPTPPPPADITPGGSETPSLVVPLPKVQSRTITFSTGTVDSIGRITHRTSKEARVRVEPLALRVNLTMVEIPAGRLLMGSSPAELRRFRQEYLRHGATAAEVADVLRRETPQHPVQLKSFLIGSTEVTRAQWAVVASWEPVAVRLREDPPEARTAELPVTNVSWRDAEEFCRRLSAKTKQSYRLPSEAEWEYACRAGTAGPFNLGSAITPAVSNYHSRFPFGGAPLQPERGHVVAAGRFRLANAFGLYDMHGNVWEWCADLWHPDYSGAPSDGRAWIDGGDDSRRPVRGGGWNDIAFFARSSQRASQPLDTTSSWIGFRVVMDPAK
jgi:formylglycine-generating enzyme required for sulfatase activity